MTGPGPARIRNRRDYREFLQQDLRAHGLVRWRFYLRLQRPELHFQRVLRRAEFLRSGTSPLSHLQYLVARVRLARLALHSGLSIPPGVFGPGLSIAHVGSVVVNDQAVVGPYCRIHSATNIGIFKGKAPVIGSRVYIGPGAVLYGGITVGDRAVIGANAVVTADVPGGVTVAGAPARVISQRGSEEVMPEWFADLP